jgi:hypothetical protein
MGTTSHLGREHRRRPTTARARRRPPVMRAERAAPDTRAGGNGRAGSAGAAA